MTNPRITVLIPTRERSDVLVHALRTVTAQNYDDLVILVSDNASKDATRDVVAAANDPRIRYINTGKRLSMSANWEFGLSHVDAGWLTVMGDDDGLMPGAVGDVANHALESDVEAIRSRVCIYDWPSILDRTHGRMTIPMGSKRSVRSSAQWLTKVLAAKAKYTELPMVYNGGFVRTEVFDRIKSRVGRFFNSAVPDVYAGIAVARNIDHYLFVEKPLALSGTSRHSTGTSTHSALKGKHIAPAQAYYTEGNFPFHAALPLNADGSFPHSLHALVYECYLQSISAHGEPPTQDHQRQLELILGSDTPHRASIEIWAEHFAARHTLNLAEARRGASTSGRLLRASRFMDATWRAAHSVILDAEEVALRDVYQASIAAAVVRARPKRISTLPRLLGRRISET